MRQRNPTKARLDVYIADDCWSCTETERLVSKVTVEFPSIAVQTIHARTGRWPDFVFATPTYVLDGRVISLGNPGWQELHELLSNALNLINKLKQAQHAKQATIKG
jgi:hypothetical protein